MCPVIETERLVLRHPEPRDVATMAVLFADYEVSKMTARIPYPYRRSHAEEFLVRAAQQRESGEAHVFVMGRKPDLYCLGNIGLHREEGAYELGYALGRNYWGQGYATEAGRAMMDFAFDTLGAGKVIAGHACDNPASARVLAKLGFVPMGEETIHSAARGQDVACLRQELTRDAMRARML